MQISDNNNIHNNNLNIKKEEQNFSNHGALLNGC